MGRIAAGGHVLRSLLSPTGVPGGASVSAVCCSDPALSSRRPVSLL